MPSDLLARELRHDVRNQLFALRTAFAALGQTSGTDDRLQRSLRLCSMSLEKLTSAMEEYFALQTGERLSEIVDLSKLVNEALAPLLPAADALGVKFDLKLDSFPLRGKNLLLSMAVKRIVAAAMGLTRGPVSISVQPNSTKVRLVVNYDARPDAAPESIQEANTGLALVSEILAIHGGKLDSAAGRIEMSLPAGQPKS